MRVHVPTALRSYTDHEATVDVDGVTVGDVLDELERRFPGFRFRVVDEVGRVREHILLLVDRQRVEDLDGHVGAGRELHIVMALSGG